MRNLEIKQINYKDAKKLYILLSSVDDEYSKYFVPFEINEINIKKILSNAIKDIFYGFFLNNELIGFFMLRGFDEGFEIPSYGVFISKKYSNYGLAKLSLNFSITYCKLNNINKMMLKVHPENKIAKHIYEKFGFYRVGFDEKNKNYIYHREIK